MIFKSSINMTANNFRLASLLLVLLSLFSHAALADSQPLGLKPPIVGLISMGQGGFDPATNDNAKYGGIAGNKLDDVIAKRNAFDGVVINIPWAELNASPTQPIDTTAIDTALANIAAYNADPKTTLPLRAILRIWAAENAPDWVKHLDGDPVQIYGPHLGAPRGTPVMIARFWTPHYRAAWVRMLNTLAAKYDGNPLIAEIANTSCTSTDDEWDALAWTSSQQLGISSINNLHAAGFTDAAFANCLGHSSEDYQAWQNTLVNFIVGDFRPTDGIKDDQIPPHNPAQTLGFMKHWFSDLGPRAVFSNHTLSYQINPNDITVFGYMKSSGIPLEFQTHSPNGLDWNDTVNAAVCLGGHALELWNSGYVGEPTPQLQAWSGQLKTTNTNYLCPILQQLYLW